MDGSTPFDNPIPGNSFYTRGHRNPQGLAYNPQEDLLYDIEHGDRTDDEINVLYAGMNYGWKTVRGYHGDNNIPGEDSIIANYTPHPLIANDSLVPALYSWCDTIPSTVLSPPTWCTVAPSDGLFYKSNIIPEFNNSLLVVTLKNGNTTDQQMYCIRLNPDGKSVAPSTIQNPNPTTYFAADQSLNGRLRDIAISPDSTTIYLVNNGGANADKITVYTLLNAALNNGTNLANAITLLPNPTTDYLTIRTDLQWTSAELIDINGRICRSIPSSEKKISTLDLEDGVYFLRFRLDQQQTVFKKFVKL
jgi:glucose/arabinose dehydrogenase